MRLTQCLIVETTPRCNLGPAHRAICPNESRERWAPHVVGVPLRDREIVDLVSAMYLDHGFRGYWGTHYYSEPLVDIGRLMHLVSEIRDRVPAMRWLLWTNGTLLPARWPWSVSPDMAYVTDYTAGGHPPVNLDVLRGVCPDVRVVPEAFDGRLDAGPVESPGPCTRMLFEFIVDWMGWVHPCCWAWRGRDAIGNVHATPLDELVKQWQDQRWRSVFGPAPDVCRRCPQRFLAVNSIDDRIGRDAASWICAEQERRRAA